MAPRNRNSDKKHSRSCRKEVRFPRREIAVRKSATVIRPPENYENLILYYLTKLKRLFATPDHPHPGSKENSADKMRRELLAGNRCSETKSKIEIDPNKYTARRSTPKPRDVKDIEQDIRDKVYNVVNAAIEYGFANNVLERKGDCFVFKNKRSSKIANRHPTPGPSFAKRSYCSQCNCTQCKNGNRNNEPCQHVRPFSERGVYRKTHIVRRPNTSANISRLPESKTQSMNKGHLNRKNRPSRSKSCIITRSNLKDRLRKVCNCRRCRLLEQKKSQRK